MEPMIMTVEGLRPRALYAVSYGGPLCICGHSRSLHSKTELGASCTKEGCNCLLFEAMPKPALCSECGTAEMDATRKGYLPHHRSGCSRQKHCQMWMEHGGVCGYPVVAEIKGVKLCGIHARHERKRQDAHDKMIEGWELERWASEEMNRKAKDLSDKLGIPVRVATPASQGNVIIKVDQLLEVLEFDE